MADIQPDGDDTPVTDNRGGRKYDEYAMCLRPGRRCLNHVLVLVCFVSRVEWEQGLDISVHCCCGVFN